MFFTLRGTQSEFRAVAIYCVAGYQYKLYARSLGLYNFVPVPVQVQVNLMEKCATVHSTTNTCFLRRNEY
eukprot:scaffold49002_cov46-Attheya_sp.AAC.1